MPCTAKKYEAERKEMQRDGEPQDVGRCRQASLAALRPRADRHAGLNPEWAVGKQLGASCSMVCLTWWHLRRGACLAHPCPCPADYVITTRELGRMLR